MDIEELKKAIYLTAQRKYNEAESLYNQLLADNPEDAVLLSAAGLFYVEQKDYDKAAGLLKKACTVNETTGTVSALGFAQYEQKHYAEAVRTFERALQLGENVDIYNKLILSLFEIKDYKKAIELTEKMKELYPDNPKTIANLVKSYTQQGKMLEAEKICIEYLRKHPAEPSLWYHLGLLKELIYSDDMRAIECYKVAEEQGNPSADYNIAVAYQKLGEYKKAEEYYKKFLQKFPNDNTGNISLGMCYLAQKRFDEGYSLISARAGGVAGEYTKNPWKPGTALEKELVIIADQGFGDRIQFVRYLPFLREHNVKVAVNDSLKSLFETNYPDVGFIDYEEINPYTQALRITDLAYALNMDFSHIPFAEGYLDIKSADIKSDKKKIGLCWEAGSSGRRSMINRTIHIKSFEPLFDLQNVQFYSFQVNDSFDGNEKYSDKMLNLSCNFKDFSDTASALKSMDAVVTVDTCIVHLAGALGIKTYLLLPYSSDWRWFDDEKTTPWYKSVEIFKQKNPISWENEINDIVKKLSA